MDNSSLTVGDVKELKKQIEHIRCKQELVFDALKCKIFSLENDIAHAQYIIAVNPKTTEEFKNLKRKSMQSKQELQNEYRNLLKEIKEDELQ